MQRAESSSSVRPIALAQGAQLGAEEVALAGVQGHVEVMRCEINSVKFPLSNFQNLRSMMPRVMAFARPGTERRVSHEIQRSHPRGVLRLAARHQAADGRASVDAGLHPAHRRAHRARGNPRALPDSGPRVAARDRVDGPAGHARRRLRPTRSIPANSIWSCSACRRPNYGAPDVRELMGRVARARKPCLAIMNMPPLPFLKRIPGLSTAHLWSLLRGSCVVGGLRTRADDAREPGSPGVSPAGSAEERPAGGTADQFQGGALRSRGTDRAAARASKPTSRRRGSHCGDGALEIPVKLKVHDSIFVPLAKWPMLIAGNYRCIRPQRHDPHPGGGARQRQRVPRDLRLGRERCAPGWAPRPTTWFRSRSTPRPPRASVNPRPRRAHCSAAPSTSSGSTAWSEGSHASTVSRPTWCRRSSRWWTSAWHRTVRAAIRRAAPNPWSKWRTRTATGSKPNDRLALKPALSEKA